jgi:hypothetical protein
MNSTQVETYALVLLLARCRSLSLVAAAAQLQAGITAAFDALKTSLLTWSALIGCIYESHVQYMQQCTMLRQTGDLTLYARTTAKLIYNC